MYANTKVKRHKERIEKKTIRNKKNLWMHDAKMFRSFFVAFSTCNKNKPFRISIFWCNVTLVVPGYENSWLKICLWFCIEYQHLGKSYEYNSKFIWIFMNSYKQLRYVVISYGQLSRPILCLIKYHIFNTIITCNCL